MPLELAAAKEEAIPMPLIKQRDWAAQTPEEFLKEHSRRSAAR